MSSSEIIFLIIKHFQPSEVKVYMLINLYKSLCFEYVTLFSWPILLLKMHLLNNKHLLKKKFFLQNKDLANNKIFLELK